MRQRRAAIALVSIGVTRRSAASSAVGVLAALLALQPSFASAQGRSAEAQDRFGVRTLSTHADRVSGGDVLVEITYPDANKNHPLIVTLNGRDVSGAFRPGEAPRTRVGLVTGLAVGKNTLTVDGRGWGLPSESLVLTNYPIEGPIISGPYQQP